MSAKSPARIGAPPSSPRLPSPPPLPELQLGPRSPSVNAPGELRLDATPVQDDGAARRVRPGTSAADMARGPPFVPLHQLESPFQLQEYLKSSYCKLTREEDSDTVKPITKEIAMQLATPPIQQDTGEPVDRNLWLYELCRFLVQRTNRLIVSFFVDNPPCSNQTCPEMRASEWQYLCAVHEPPKSCCAIDYCCHTLDWAANILTSTKHFPSRLSLGGEGGGGAYQSMKQLTNIFRRVYRIYAHAWFQHREVFWSLEQEEGLYKFFRTVCDAYALIPDDNYTIPNEAEGERAEEVLETPVNPRPHDMQILRNDTQVQVTQQQQQPQSQAPPPKAKEPEQTSVSTQAPTIPTTTTRRHRHTPSTGTQVTMIAEGAEEEEEDLPNEPNRISQQTPAEPTATLTDPTTSSPPEAKSPRPGMSIPLGQTKQDLRAPEDPTPTPESHTSDPFDSPSTKGTTIITAPSSTTDATPSSKTHLDPTDIEPPTPLTAVDRPSSLPPAMPPLQTEPQTPPPASTANRDDEEVRSPGGGSYRTIGGDILSGLLRHVESDMNKDGDSKDLGGHLTESDKDSAVETEANEASSTVNEPAETTEKGSEVSSKEEESATRTSREDENKEEMGEIKPGGSSTRKEDEQASITDTRVESDEGKDGGTEKEVDEKKENADGIKTEEAPSGVV